MKRNIILIKRAQKTNGNMLNKRYKIFKCRPSSVSWKQTSPKSVAESERELNNSDLDTNICNCKVYKAGVPQVL